jgi:23S rRNA (uridine2552-2'-O)-methyltransferase
VIDCRGGPQKHAAVGGMSSARWLARQRVDEWVLKAQREGYRSRAAYKLQQISARMKPPLLRRGLVALELGAAPGSWTQVLVKHGLQVVGVDLLPIEPVEGATLLRGDFTDETVQQRLLAALAEGGGDGQADLLLSDVSPSRSGNATLDGARMLECNESSLALATRCLRPGGTFVCKVLEGAELRPLMERTKPMFTTSGGLVKPKASRPRSREVYLVARGFDPESFAARTAW